MPRQLGQLARLALKLLELQNAPLESLALLLRRRGLGLLAQARDAHTEAQRVLAREVETFMEVAEALAALRREADRNNIQIRIDDFDNPDAEQEG